MKIPLSKVRFFQNAGFLTLLVLCWLVECAGVRPWVLGDRPYLPDFREAALETLLLLCLWGLVAAFTRRLLRHAHELEGFLRICSWCHHINYQGRWIGLEEFLRMGFDTPTTHGICPLCLEKQMTALKGVPPASPQPPDPDRSSLPPAWRQVADEVEAPGK